LPPSAATTTTQAVQPTISEGQNYGLKVLYDGGT